MKHPELATTLTEEARYLGLVIAENQADALIDHLLWLVDTNRRVNLTAIGDVEQGLRLHLIDSLAALPELQDAPTGAALDIGTGGGFPGLPLAIVSGRPFTLLDSVAKKAAVLNEYVASAGIDGVRVLGCRSEALAREEAGGFSVVVARAVAGLPSLLELSAPLLRVGGRLIALKGAPSEAEVNSADSVSGLLGFELSGQRAFVLPGAGERRTVLVFTKVKDSSVALPRREGLAQRKPLG